MSIRLSEIFRLRWMCDSQKPIPGLAWIVSWSEKRFVIDEAPQRSAPKQSRPPQAKRLAKHSDSRNEITFFVMN
jgi:hypothetical protein